jgi:glutathione S-transferase
LSFPPFQDHNFQAYIPKHLDKPEWYKELVPTTLVLAVLFHGEQQQQADKAGNNKPERKSVWESLAVIKALDDDFPDNAPRMIFGTPEFEAAMLMSDELNKAGFAKVYSFRDTSLTESNKEECQQASEAELNKLEDALHGDDKS